MEIRILRRAIPGILALKHHQGFDIPEGDTQIGSRQVVVGKSLLRFFDNFAIFGVDGFIGLVL